ncbi:DNA internalization-related competence protein ComEC/Rec2 [Comamonas serinivorans]|uniref:DNA internalization-related competence protein ComEC/Rec2 n=1 Tax=Comamonas serinivorans TaxID=1082851 RepID=A0A1Y0EME9_9BURK|nr:DNA internalization-related competence protein ComEC/Rec2 [Comamonas serinivorans]ARU04803.1 DNA internalization-related competence protein ComEC/Rec2 [Comamonas serinivorans]
MSDSGGAGGGAVAAQDNSVWRKASQRVGELRRAGTDSRQAAGRWRERAAVALDRTWTGSWLALGWVLGTALQLQQAQLSARWCYGLACGMGLLGLACLGWLRHAAWVGRGLTGWPPPAMRKLAWLVLAGVLAWSSTGWRASMQLAQRLPANLDGSTWRLTARVADLPVRTASGMRLVLWVEQATREGDAHPASLPALPMRLQLHVADQPWPDAPEAVMARVRQLQGLRAHETWALSARLRVPRGLMNPHGFDQELWLWSRGIAATASPLWQGEVPQQVAAPTGWTLAGTRERVRQQIAQVLHAADPRSMQLVTALTMGDQSSIAEGDWQVFRDTGVAHLVSISGLHITGLAALAMGLAAGWWRLQGRLLLHLRPAWLTAQRLSRQSWSRWSGLAVALAYSAFSGWGIPAQRTVLMLAAWCVLRELGVRWPWLTQALLVMALVVAVDPWALLQAGFWLSFVAVAVLLHMTTQADVSTSQSASPSAGDSTSATSDSPPRPGWRRPWAWLTRAGWQLLRLQLLLLVALAPLTASWFGQVSLVGVLANLVAVPWVTWLITPLCLLGLLWPMAWQLAALVAEPLLAILRQMAAWPQASWQVEAAPWPWMALAAAGATLFVVVQRARQVVWWRVLAVAWMLPALFWRTPRPDSGQFEVLALDVGQGSAIVVRTARHTLLYDAGPRYGPVTDAGERVVLPLLRALGDRVDRLVLSHADADHAGGAERVLQAQPRAELWGSMAPDDPWPAMRPGWQRCAAGQHWTWDGVRFEVLFPSVHWVPNAHARNEGSCVLRVLAAPNADQAAPTVLLTGDIGQRQEAALVRDHGGDQPPFARLQAQLLMAPHHGSGGSSSEAFLQAVRPDWVLVQAGHGNRFGHPAPAMLGRARAAGAQVRVTTGCGAMQWRSAAPQVVRCQRELDRRYWHVTSPVDGGAGGAQ